jgi:Peptidase MA superfamily
MTNKVLLFFLTLSFCASVSGAADMLQYKGPGVVVSYPSALRGAAVSLAGAYPGIKSDLETKLGWKANFTPLVVLIRRNSEFRGRVQNDLVTAFAVPGQDLIVIDYSKMERTPFDIDATLEHELCHLLLHRNVQSPPKWLDEGVAQWASGGIADIINPGEKDILKQTSLSGRLIPLQNLSVSFPDEPRGFLLAYEESKSFVEYMAHEYGTGKLRTVLFRMQEGETADKALESALGLNLDTLQEAWQRSLRIKYSWPSYLANNLFWILFFAAALVTLIGYIQAKKRMKNYRDEEEDVPGDDEVQNGDKLE